jgi:hypothetical protein
VWWLCLAQSLVRLQGKGTPGKRDQPGPKKSIAKDKATPAKGKGGTPGKGKDLGTPGEKRSLHVISCSTLPHSCTVHTVLGWRQQRRVA